MNTVATPDISILPPLLQDFESLIGLAATMKLVEKYGGLRIYIPAKADPNHPMAHLIGTANLAALGREFGGIPHFQLPKADRALKALRNARIAADSRHKSARMLALEYKLTEGQIVRILSRYNQQDERQTDLF